MVTGAPMKLVFVLLRVLISRSLWMTLFLMDWGASATFFRTAALKVKVFSSWFVNSSAFSLFFFVLFSVWHSKRRDVSYWSVNFIGCAPQKIYFYRRSIPTSSGCLPSLSYKSLIASARQIAELLEINEIIVRWSSCSLPSFLTYQFSNPLGLIRSDSFPLNFPSVFPERLLDIYYKCLGFGVQLFVCF